MRTALIFALAFLALLYLERCAQAQYYGPRVPYGPYAPYGSPRDIYRPPQPYYPPQMGPDFTWRWRERHGAQGYRRGIDEYRIERFYRPWPPYGPP